MCFALAAMSPSDSLPTDLDGLRALLLAERAHHAEELERLTAIIKELQRHRFGRRAERLDPEQLALALEDVEQTLAAADAAAENDTTAQKQATPRRRHINRGALPVHFVGRIGPQLANRPSCSPTRRQHRCGEPSRSAFGAAMFRLLHDRRVGIGSRAEQGKSYGRAAQRAFLPLRASFESATYRTLYREVRG
jgi:hypothetical protein